jgi:uncharacterized protein (TIGR03437 family)
VNVLITLSLFVNVLTYQYDNTRAGANKIETLLTPANVNSSQFGKLFSQSVDGYIYGQPLYFAGVPIPGKGTHNVVYAATEHDSVYAFDADSNMAPLWQVSFLSSGVTSVPASDTGCSQIAPEIGITSTPVIDPQSGTIYLVAMTKESGGYVQRLHALDITTGAERPESPVVIQASVPGTGEGGTTLVFKPEAYKQRPGLLLLNGVLYTLWSSHCDLGTYHGWIIGYDAQSLQQVTVFNDTPNGTEASFWMGGAAPAVDAAGNMYVVAANGSTDTPSGGSDLGESYVRLTTSGGLALADYFTPFNYQELNQNDLDTGSSGVALLGDEAGSSAHPHLMAGAGKEGRIYLLDRDNLGGFNASSDSEIVQSFTGEINGLFGNPAYFNYMLYFCGSGDQLKAFPVSNAQMATSPQSQSPSTFAFPGCVPTISANGTSNGIVWAIDPAGLLHAYDATNVGNEFYNSNQNSARDALGSAVRFSVPTVANGKVYAGTQNSLVVYGLLAQSAAITIANAASGSATALAPGSIASLYGTNLPASPTITVNGVNAPVFAATTSQINFQIPYQAATGAATVSLNGSTGSSATIQLQAVAPGLFTQTGGQAAVQNQDYSVNSPDEPAAAGTVIAAYLTGLGPVQPPAATGVAAPLNTLSMTTGKVTAMIGNTPAAVQFAGLAPGFTGLYQVNIVVPPVPPGQYPLQISIDGASSNLAPINTD